ncbi:hypothetical protein [Arthrobacter sp. A5]|uniref:hypothetical protein n=1 Tax=Arthrobacter sp. A5 TaxID=576926 RepID=UPI003DA9ABDB
MSKGSARQTRGPGTVRHGPGLPVGGSFAGADPGPGTGPGTEPGPEPGPEIVGAGEADGAGNGGDTGVDGVPVAVPAGADSVAVGGVELDVAVLGTGAGTGACDAGTAGCG